jgi:hypothetical protein
MYACGKLYTHARAYSKGESRVKERGKKSGFQYEYKTLQKNGHVMKEMI